MSKFECMNNIVEYEALILEPNMVRFNKIKFLSIFGDFELIICQIRDGFMTKNSRLKRYKINVWDLLEFSDAFSINWIDREYNFLVDMMANLAIKKLTFHWKKYVTLR